MALHSGSTHFTKTNQTPNPDTLLREAEGLQLLAATLKRSGSRRLKVPKVVRVDQRELMMTAIHAREPEPRQMQALGAGLAELHRVRQRHYGLGSDNYIGLAPQPNHVSDNWGEFFVACRLEFQIGRMRDQKTRKSFAEVLRRQRNRTVAFLNDSCDRPSLLHGDLWSGNVLFDSTDVWLIDPAVYRGDREADLAMTEMFGGFSADFYRSYDAAWPRTDAYPLKKTVYNFYHYLNHYNLFGAAYLDASRRCLETIEAL